MIGIAFATLTYNFFNMYSIVGQCTDGVAQPCQAYNNWASLNKLGIGTLIIGVVVLTIGFMKHRRS